MRSTTIETAATISSMAAAPCAVKGSAKKADPTLKKNCRHLAKNYTTDWIDILAVKL